MKRDKGQTVYIRTLGKFEVRRGNCAISDDTSRSHQLWNLLEYLVIHRREKISQEELVQLLWPEGNSDNPSNALKNLVYRIRSAFVEAGFPDGKEMILCKDGNYSLNPDLEYELDTEDFERLCRQGEDPSLSIQEQCGHLLEALVIYRGIFLKKSSFELWVAPHVVRYHDMWLQAVERAARLLQQTNRHETIVDICRSALEIDRREEIIYIQLIRALIALDRQKQAMEVFHEVSALHYDLLGVRPSRRLRDLYCEIIRSVNMEESDLQMIVSELKEKESGEGAFVCEYEIFRNIYQLESRAIERSGRTALLVLVSVTAAEGARLENRVRKNAMERLLEILRSNLRRGDVVARFSATQFVVMLYTLAYEDGEMVMERVIKQFANSYRNPTVRVTAKVQPLDPSPLS